MCPAKVWTGPAAKFAKDHSLTVWSHDDERNVSPPPPLTQRTLLTSAACPGGDAKKCFANGGKDVYAGLAGCGSSMLTYVVVWMVIYNCIYVF